ncbi:helix-turn-helix domain-containing protein [Methylobacterium sp. A54F]
MRKTLRTTDHARLVEVLKQARLRQDLTQQVVADRLGVPQSFVAKYEGGERRLDVIEFIAVAQAIEVDPIELLQQVVGGA